MTDERVAIEALARCRFPPATFAKRFARSLNERKENSVLTPRQRHTLHQVCHHFRRQLPRVVQVWNEVYLSLPVERQNFENTLDSRPDDASAALIYADWLEEHGEPALALAHRLTVERKWFPHLVPCGASYGPDGTSPINFEWTLGMKAWQAMDFREAPHSPLPAYHHRSRQAAMAALAGYAQRLAIPAPLNDCAALHPAFPRPAGPPRLPPRPPPLPD